MTKCPQIRLERSDGAEFVINNYKDDSSGWVTKGLSGWDELELSVKLSANVLTDGSSLISKRVESIDRTVSARYIGKKSLTDAKAQARAFFNPKYTYKAYYTLGDTTRWCEGELYGLKITDSTFVDVDFTIICADPYFRDNIKNDSPFGDSVNGFGFPYVCHMENDRNRPLDHPVGVIVSYLIFDGKNTVYNSGDVPTYYRVVIDAKGVIKNPAITKDDKMVRVMKTLQAGDTLIIDFEASPPKVLLNGKNIIHACSRNSNFVGMMMQTGSNKFSFKLDNPENRSLAQVTVEFYKKYLGA